MSGSDRGLFAERGARPRSRAAEAGPSPALPSPAPAVGDEPAPPPADAADVLRELRVGVRATVDEWLSERSHTVSLAVAQVVEDALTSLQVVHAARLRELAAGYEDRLAALERERAEAVRGALRRRRARVRAVEQELRARIERLERALTESSLETIEKLREVERRETERRLASEAELKQALREKDDEILRLRLGGKSSDDRFEALADQLRARRPGGHEH